MIPLIKRLFENLPHLPEELLKEAEDEIEYYRNEIHYILEEKTYVSKDLEVRKLQTRCWAYSIQMQREQLRQGQFLIDNGWLYRYVSQFGNKKNKLGMWMDPQKHIFNSLNAALTVQKERSQHNA